jgi:hypothetical protein
VAEFHAVASAKSRIVAAGRMPAGAQGRAGPGATGPARADPESRWPGPTPNRPGRRQALAATAANLGASITHQQGFAMNSIIYIVGLVVVVVAVLSFFGLR